MSKPIRIYWDACTWIAFINKDDAVLQGDGTLENRFLGCESILNQAKQGKFEIIVSAFTLAEVCKSKDARTIDKKILTTLFDDPFIFILPVDKNIGLNAQILQTSEKITLKPADAVHIATAQYRNAEEFHTFDGGLLKLDGIIFADNGNPIKICKP